MRAGTNHHEADHGPSAAAATPGPSSVHPFGDIKNGAQRLAVEYRAAAALIPYARNSRTHSDAQVAQIAASIREFGWTNPVLVDGDNGIIAGHGRLLAAYKLGMATVPVIELAGLSEAQKRAYIIADNKMALNAGWDNELLGLELGELDALGFDLSLTGFGEDEIATLTSLGTAGLTDPDDIPAAPEQPATLPGDVWIMGKHRLICGDSTKAADVERVLYGVKPHLLVSDPPFGVNYDPSWRKRLGVPSEGLAKGTVLNDDRSDWREARALFPGDVIYIWHAALHSVAFAASLEACGFAIRAQIIWDKTRLVIGRGDYHWQHEPAWYAVRRAGKAIGRVIASRLRSGRSRTGSRLQATARKSRSNACVVRSRTIPRRARPCTSHSRVRAPPSSPRR